MHRRLFSGLFFFLLAFLGFWLIFNYQIPKSDTKLSKKDFIANQPKTFQLVAIGDSLTEGVGDITKQGGFVPLLKQSLHLTYGYETLTTNYGVSGNTSNQILKRMQKQSDIKSHLKSADLMTLTVGGNDVMAVIRKNLTRLSVHSFDKPAKDYQERLRQILTLSRTQNKDLPIYVLGIYNPFYLNFPEMTEMQDIVTKWNKATEQVVSEYDNVYFVPINDLLYKGLDGQEGVVSVSGDKTEVINDVLFSEDHFHPNNLGYQLMATAIMEKISETKADWK